MGIGMFEILIILAIVALLFGPGAVIVYLLVKGSGPEAGNGVAGADGRDPALEAARERYARGEIGRAEFEEIKATLGH